MTKVLDIAKRHGLSPLVVAMKINLTQVARQLIAQGEDVNSASATGVTPLLMAVERENRPIFDLLIAAGADVNIGDKNGTTPLIVAAAYAFYSYVNDLILAGADVNKRSPAGGTALMMAASYVGNPSERARVVDALISAKADVNMATTKGMTALMYAAQKGSDYIVEALIKAGADVNSVNGEDISPVMAAAAGGFTRIVALLAAAGADVNKANIKGGTPLSIAAYHKYTDTVDALLAYGADISVPVNDHIRHTILEHATRGEFDPAINKLILESAEDIFSRDARTVDVAGAQVFDPVMYDHLPFSNAYENNDNIIFKIKTEFFSYPVAQLRAEIVDKSSTTYACNRMLYGAPYVKDVDIANPYFILRGNGNYAVPLTQIRHVARHAYSRLFELIDTGDAKEFMASYGSVMTDAGRDQSGRPVNIVGADHCQTGSRRAIYTLQELHIAPSRNRNSKSTSNSNSAKAGTKRNRNRNRNRNSNGQNAKTRRR